MYQPGKLILPSVVFTQFHPMPHLPAQKRPVSNNQPPLCKRPFPLHMPDGIRPFQVAVKAERTAEAPGKTCKDLSHLQKAMAGCQRHEPCRSTTCRLIACLASLSTTHQGIIDRSEISEDLVTLILMRDPLQELPEDLIGYRLCHIIQHALFPILLPHICPTPFLTQRHTARSLPLLWPPRGHSADPDSSPHPPQKPVSVSGQRSSPHIAPLTAPGSVLPFHSRKVVILVRFPVSFRSFPPSLFLTSMVDGHVLIEPHSLAHPIHRGHLTKVLSMNFPYSSRQPSRPTRHPHVLIQTELGKQNTEDYLCFPAHAHRQNNMLSLVRDRGFPTPEGKPYIPETPTHESYCYSQGKTSHHNPHTGTAHR